MRIAIISPSFLPVPALKGGAIETLIQLFIDQNELEYNDLTIHVISAYNKEAETLSKTYRKTDFFWIHYQSFRYKVINCLIRAIRRVFHFDLYYFSIYFIKKALMMQPFDKVIVEGSPRQVESILKLVDKEKIYFHVHANVFNKKTSVNKAIVEGCNKVIVVSNYIKKRVMIFSEAQDNQIEVLKNCIDLTSYEIPVNRDKQGVLRSQYGIQTSDVVIVFAGRVVADKGIIELIDALNYLPQQCPFKLLVIGSFGSKFGLGDSEPLLRKQLDRISCNTRKNIIYTGFVHNSEMHSFHSISDIAVVPSISEEAAGLVAIEAMASGLPLVITNSGGLPEYVNTNCAIILKRDEKLTINLAISLEKLITNRELRQAMGRAGKTLSKQYGRKIYYNKLIDILNK